MESFAFWYRTNPTGNNGDVSAVMNFNLWSQCGWDSAPLLDIGFKIENLCDTEELYLFLPFSIQEADKKEYIEDLGCKFKETELVDAVFNESHATTIAANTKTIEVEQVNKSEKFKIYQLDITHDIELEAFADGTIIKIKTCDIIGDWKNNTNGAPFPKYYLRFRIKNQWLPFLIHQYTSPSKALQSMFNTTYMIDFRYHNIRSLDKTLIEKFSAPDNHVVEISALHFLLMTKAYVDVTDKEFKSIRKIEQGVWKNYVDGKDTEDLVAYHYAHKPKGGAKYISSSELFTKFRVEKSVIWQYIIFTILLGVMGSFFGSVLFEGVKLLLRCQNV